MGDKTELKFRHESYNADFSIEEAVDAACYERLAEGQMEQLKANQELQAKMLGRLLAHLVLNNVLTGENCKDILGYGWRMK